MLFSTSLPLDSLVLICRTFRHGLSAGLSLVDVVRQQGRKGPLIARPVLTRIADRLDTGESWEDALAPEREQFPPLFTALTGVGEQTGNLPDIFGELETYFRQQVQIRNQFRQDIRWPVFQLVAAQFVIAGLIWILGALGVGGGKTGYDPLGFNLFGTSGAIIYLSIVGGIAFGVYMLYASAKSQFRAGKAMVDRTLLKVWVIGPCLEAIALARFCLGLKLTFGAGLNVKKALQLSLQAASNGAYTEAVESALPMVKKGKPLHEILTSCGVFPEQFLNIVETAEESGRIPESMGQQATQYAEEAHFRMQRLAQVAGWVIYGAISVFMIFMIFRMYGNYLGLIDRAASGRI